MERFSTLGIQPERVGGLKKGEDLVFRKSQVMIPDEQGLPTHAKALQGKGQIFAGEKIDVAAGRTCRDDGVDPFAVHRRCPDAVPAVKNKMDVGRQAGDQFGDVFRPRVLMARLRRRVPVGDAAGDAFGQMPEKGARGGVRRPQAHPAGTRPPAIDIIADQGRLALGGLGADGDNAWCGHTCQQSMQPGAMNDGRQQWSRCRVWLHPVGSFL